MSNISRDAPVERPAAGEPVQPQRLGDDLRRSVMRGLSDENGSWKTMCSSRRSGRSARRERCVMSVPRRRIVPAVGSTSRRMHFAIVDLPLPDSPTSPSISPAAERERDAVDRVHEPAAAGDPPPTR